MERRLKVIEEEILKFNIPIHEPSYIPDAPDSLDLTYLKGTIEKLETELQNAVTCYNDIRYKYLYLEQKKFVILVTNRYFELAHEMRFEPPPSDDEHAPMLEEAETISMHSFDESIQFCYVAGVILQTKVPAFEIMLWRMFSWNVIVHVKPLKVRLEDPQYNTPVLKSVFIIFFRGKLVKEKICTVCESFKATIYDCPDYMPERMNMVSAITMEMRDMQIVMGETCDYHHSLLVFSAKNLRVLSMKVLKMKSIYCTLNMLRVTPNSVIACCWIPLCKLQLVTSALVRATKRRHDILPPVVTRLSTSETPPTYNTVNKYTAVFQSLVDSYGFARYDEINPAPLSISTFPFLFAVMFGDVGHGLLLLIVGICFQMTENWMKWLKMGEIMKLFFEGRYLIILMGLFSIYTGLLYNECFSFSLNLFGSQWTANFTEHTVLGNNVLWLNPETHFSASTYPFGFDPVWKVSENGLDVMNSFKMKLSVILGVGHMLFGICLSFYNFKHCSDHESIIGQFIPRLLFMSALFLYLVFLFFLKWTIYGPHKSEERSSHCAPSIIMTFIMMFLLQTPKNTVDGSCDPYMFPYQYHVQMLLLSVAGICIPWMLLYKPIRVYLRNRAATLGLPPVASDLKQHGDAIELDDIEQRDDKKPSATQTGELSCSEMFLQQVIHTVEFVLCTASHTASYLRLWALSLAHSELSGVLWTMVFRPGVRAGWPLGPICTAVCFAVWAVATAVIIITVEGLCSFLHTLRLHWIEFQSKFYSGNGHGFAPFSFETLLEDAHLYG